MLGKKEDQSSFDIQFQKRITNGALFHDQVNLPMIGLAVGFKAFAVLLYFFLGGTHLLDFIAVLLLTSIDFWTTKNLTGRQLVGLRWWIQADKQSEEQAWIFQSCNPNRQINQINHSIFWVSLLMYNVFWIVMAIFHLIVHLVIYVQIFWFSLSSFCLLLSGVNLMCYYKCAGKHQQRARQLIQKIGMGSATNMVDEQIAQVTEED